jgi:TRAP-type C4-dicarboxylate transport system permease small subunit
MAAEWEKSAGADGQAILKAYRENRSHEAVPGPPLRRERRARGALRVPDLRADARAGVRARHGRQIRGADDIVSWLCAAAAFFALGHTFRHGELVRVGLWLDAWPARARGRRSSGRSASPRCSRLHAVGGERFVYESWQFNEVAQGLIKVPIWIPQMSFLVGVLIFFVAVLDELVRCCEAKARLPGRRGSARAAGDFSETL